MLLEKCFITMGKLTSLFFFKFSFFLNKFFFEYQINTTGFLNNNYDDLDKTDLNVFFNDFKKHITTHQMGEMELTEFLKGKIFCNGIFFYLFSKLIFFLSSLSRFFITMDRNC